MLPQNDTTVVCLVNAESLCSLLFFSNIDFPHSAETKKQSTWCYLEFLSWLCAQDKGHCSNPEGRCENIKEDGTRSSKEGHGQDVKENGSRSRTSQEHARRTSTQAAHMQSSFKILTQGHLRKNLFDSTGRPQRINKNTQTNIPYTKSSDTQLTS